MRRSCLFGRDAG